MVDFITGFDAALHFEVCGARHEYEKSKKAYEKVLKDFICRHIVKRKEFNELYQTAHEDAVFFYMTEPVDLHIDKMKTLEWIVKDFRSFLENYASEGEQK
jgi:hypothetical protein